MSLHFGAAWMVWLLMFGVIEWIAIKNGQPGDTLSEWVWWVIGKHPLAWWLVGGFLSWMVIHFLSKGKWA